MRHGLRSSACSRLCGVLVLALMLAVACQSQSELAPPAPSTYTAQATAQAIATGAPQPTPQPSIVARRELPRQRAKSTAPNVLLISIDTLRADHIGAYGNARIKTPAMDALAQRGARFEMAIAQFSQTNPSHVSLLTGTYPATHKVKVHGIDKVSPSVYTLAEVLAAGGYNTAGIYSWPSLDPEMSGLDRGFVTYRGVYFATPGQEGHPDFWRRWSGTADRTTDAALQWLDGNLATPFFLWLHYQDPHYPFTPPPPFDAMYDSGCRDCADGGWSTIDRIHAGQHLSDADIASVVDKYDGAISFTDHEIGRLLDGMGVSKLLANTVVILTADHGESFGEHSEWLHPFILHNTVIRVPLIVSYPPTLPTRKVVGALAQSVDVVPTILDLAGLRYPSPLEGKSLLPLISEADNGSDRVAFTQVPDDSRIAMTTKEWKLLRNNATGDLELYNLRTDPGEQHNVASDNAAKVSELEQRLKVWMSGHGIATPQ